MADQPPPISRSDRRQHHLPRYDRTLLWVTLGLLVLGLVMVTSAAMPLGQRLQQDPFLFTKRALFYSGLALLLSLLILQIPMRIWQQLGVPMMLISMLLLLLVLIVGTAANGAVRWIAIGPLHLQPAELAKLSLFCYLSGYLVREAQQAAVYLGSQVTIWHQVGIGALQSVTQAYQEVALLHTRINEFIEDIAAAYAWADLVVCRAGALTISELAAVGLSAILVPFQHADRQQYLNAQVLHLAGAAEILEESQLTAQKLAQHINRYDWAVLLQRAQRVRICARLDATQRVASVLQSVAKRSSWSGRGGEKAREERVGERRDVEKK